MSLIALASVGLATIAPAHSGPAPTTGALTQKAGTAGCMSLNGSSGTPSYTQGVCQVGTGLFGASAVAVSPDGRNVYVAAVLADAVVVLDRDPATGRLSEKSGTARCISENGSDGAPQFPTPGQCQDGVGLQNVQSITVAPDGKNVYTTSADFGGSRTIGVFDRNTTTGALTQKAGTAGCISKDGTSGHPAYTPGACQTMTHRGPMSVSISPDGKNAYATAIDFSEAKAVMVFDRNATTGALTQKPGTAGCISEDGTGGACQDGTAVGTAGMTVSPDGKNAYSATTAGALAIFDRNTTTGELTQKAGTAGCISEDGTGGACQDGTALAEAKAIVISPDGANAYAASIGGGAVSVFDRNTTTGALTQKAGTAGCISDDGTSGRPSYTPGACQDGTALAGAQSVAVAPDGHSVYMASFFSPALSVFDRDPSSGALTQRPGKEGCISEDGTSAHGDDAQVCQDGTALSYTSSVAVSPDNFNVYVAAQESHAVAVFNRVAPCTSHRLSDVPPWVSDAVDWAYCDDFMTGYPDDTFRPDLSITRAQVGRLLYRVAGSPDVSGLPAHGLSDVPLWVDDTVTWLKANNYMTGYPDGTFRPDIPISRGQVTRASYRVQGSPGGAPPHPFSDVPPWLTDAVNWAADDPDGAGGNPPLMTGFNNGTFRQQLDITRAQTVRLQCRANTAPGTC